MSAKVITTLIFLSLGVVTASLHAEDLDINQCRDRILSYEALYDNVKIEMELPNIGNIKLAGPIKKTLVYQDCKSRSDTELQVENLVKSTRLISDGEKSWSWSRDNLDALGQGIVQVEDEYIKSQFYKSVFNIFQLDLDGYDEAEIVSQDENNVKIKFLKKLKETDSVLIEKVAVYGKYKGYLRPLEISGQKIASNPIDQSHPLNWNTFEYDNPESLYPSKLEYGNEVHKMHSIFILKSVEQNPKLEPDFFKMEFPIGTYVQDKINGVTSQN